MFDKEKPSFIWDVVNNFMKFCFFKQYLNIIYKANLFTFSKFQKVNFILKIMTHFTEAEACDLQQKQRPLTTSWNQFEVSHYKVLLASCKKTTPKMLTF